MKITDYQNNQWFRRGYDDAEAGVTVGKNPFKGGPQWKHWRRGWYAATNDMARKAATSEPEPNLHDDFGSPYADPLAMYDR